jgi:hypothetical protein
MAPAPVKVLNPVLKTYESAVVSAEIRKIRFAGIASADA